MGDWKDLCEAFQVTSPSVSHREDESLYQPCQFLKNIKGEVQEGGEEGGREGGKEGGRRREAARGKEGRSSSSSN
jgi:hypothetical protein